MMQQSWVTIGKYEKVNVIDSSNLWNSTSGIQIKEYEWAS